ncbi:MULTISPECIES: winged helix-turn-helix domain-containing protein [Bradyrhizobium]
MSIVDAAKALLASKRTPLKNPELAAMFKAGGLHMNSKEPANTIGSVLTRRMADVGDVVRVGRGTWGFKEWYPNRSFKVKDDDKRDDKGPQETSESPIKPPPY